MRICDWIFRTTLIVLVFIIEYRASISYTFTHSIIQLTIFCGVVGSTFERKKAVIKKYS